MIQMRFGRTGSAAAAGRIKPAQKMRIGNSDMQGMGGANGGTQAGPGTAAVAGGFSRRRRPLFKWGGEVRRCRFKQAARDGGGPGDARRGYSAFTRLKAIYWFH